MAPTITAEQRDALYDQILVRLHGIDDLRLVVCAGDFDTAQRLGQEYADYLLLVLNDLGWGEGSGRGIELTAPHDVLQRAFTRMRQEAAALQTHQAREVAEALDGERQSSVLIEACDQVLADLDGGGHEG